MANKATADVGVKATATAQSNNGRTNYGSASVPTGSYGAAGGTAKSTGATVVLPAQSDVPVDRFTGGGYGASTTATAGSSGKNNTTTKSNPAARDRFDQGPTPTPRNYNQDAVVIPENEWGQYNQDATIVQDMSLGDLAGNLAKAAAGTLVTAWNKATKGDSSTTSSGLLDAVTSPSYTTGAQPSGPGGKVPAYTDTATNGATTSTQPTSTQPTSTQPTSLSDAGGGSSGGGSSGGGSSNGTGYTDAELLAQALAAAGLTAEPYQLPTIDGPNPERVEHVDTTELRNLLQQIMDSQAQQGGSQIDYTVEQGVNALNRAMEDAALQYQTQRDQATADELRALDNQALYAEARGDRGGIGEAQYGSIQAAAAQNRRAVNDAQVKLGTDTARQIADLRAQGEFQKADQLLSLTQNYLSQLMGLEQWALEANLGVDEFNSRLQQWVDEYNLNVQQFLTDLDLSAAQLTGVFSNGTKTLAYQRQLQESLSNSGAALLSAGILPSRQQLEAMGMTVAQARAYINKMNEE